MKTIERFSALALLFGASAACGIFENPSPEAISVRVSGEAGSQVTAIYAQIFTAGINRETNTTEVRVQVADTVVRTLPMDTIIDIRESRQLFVQLQPAPGDTIPVAVRVEVDGRNVLDEEGLIFFEDPWRYVYQFNRPLTDVVEVVF